MSLLRVPPPEVVQQAGSTLSVVCQALSPDPNLEIQWYQITSEDVKFPVKNSSVDLQGRFFVIQSVSFLRANIFTIVTSTLTIERMSTAYVGTYACRAVAGEIKADSDAFQVRISGMAASHLQQIDNVCYAFNYTALKWYVHL